MTLDLTEVLKALITGLPALIAALGAVWVLIRPLKKSIEEVKVATDGLTEKLIKAKEIVASKAGHEKGVIETEKKISEKLEAHAAGVKEEKDRTRETRDGRIGDREGSPSKTGSIITTTKEHL